MVGLVVLLLLRIGLLVLHIELVHIAVEGLLEVRRMALVDRKVVEGKATAFELGQEVRRIVGAGKAIATEEDIGLVDSLEKGTGCS